MTGTRIHIIQKRSISIFCLLCVFFFGAQSQCFQIESILVDACDGNNEGKNEMVTFKVGSSPLNVSNLNVNWPNNSWNGICQNASTAASVASINSSIVGCGFLKEPVGGILPANSTVILITSIAFNPTANSFVNLSDTLIVIFQCAGNTAGHFANFGTGLRSLSMSFSSPGSCNDAVTYNRALLTMPGGALGTADGAAVQFSPSGAATYVNFGCQAPYIPVTIDAGPNKTICNNTSQSFSAIATGGYTSVIWGLGGNATGTFAPSNALNTTYTPGTGDNGTIKLYCSLFKTCGTQTIVVKDSVNLTVNQLPQPVIAATTNSLCPGQFATLSFSLANSATAGTTTALWLPNSVSAPSITVNSGNLYSVNVSNSCGDVTVSYSITSYPTPTVSITANGPTQSCSGGNVLLTASSNTGNYLWTGSATTQSISVNTTATMVVTSTNVCGSAQATQTISISPATLSLTAISNSVNCFGGNNGSATVTATGGANPYNYSWSPNVSANSTANNLSNGVYTVTANDANNCSQTTFINISQPNALTASISNTAATCAGNNGSAAVTVTGGTTPYSYTWTPTNEHSSAITNLSNGVYAVSVSDNNGCSTSANTSLSNPNAISISLNTSSVSCFGGSNGSAGIIASGGLAPYTYSWSATASNVSSISNLSSGSYTVKVIDNAACASILSFSITEPTALTVVVSGTTACSNQSVSIAAQASGGTGTYTYSWDNGVFNGANYSIQPTTNTIYSVTATDGNGCQSSDTAYVTLSTDINFNALSDITNGCPTLCINFRDTILSSSGIVNQWFWDFGDGTTGNGTTANHCYSTSGVYSVSLTVSTSQGCTKTIVRSNYINVFPKPNADFNASTFETDIDNALISFNDLSTNADNWNWKFDDNSYSNLQNPDHTYLNEGNYITTLIVYDRNNCVDSISKLIVIGDNFTFYSPNTFTPNGDQKNDLFLPLGNGWNETAFELRIFDRWGAMIYRTNDPTKGWDNKLSSGEAAKADVYVWQVELKDTHQKEHYFVGHITLIK